uniref:Uncharacterized protein n=1 Tax=Anguilla anguilla TaxID=7936 RepID=A0A0E9UFB5_ANGAN
MCFLKGNSEVLSRMQARNGKLRLLQSESLHPLVDRCCH